MTGTENEVLSALDVQVLADLDPVLPCFDVSCGRAAEWAVRASECGCQFVYCDGHKAVWEDWLRDPARRMVCDFHRIQSQILVGWRRL